MRFLVLGGGGFIGSHICAVLLSQGHYVRIFQRTKSVCFESLPNRNRSEFILGDFVEYRDFKSLTNDIDVIFHLISSTVPKDSNESVVNDLSSNVLPTLQLLEAIKDTGVKKIIYASSGGTVYGIPTTIPINETHEKNPISAYGVHKLMIEKYLALYKRLYDLKYSVMRIANPYGEGQWPTRGQGIIATLIQKALSKQSIEIWGDGSVVRDYIHVSDVARAAIRLVEYDGSQTVFNIGSGQGRTIKQLVEEVEKAFGSPINVEYASARSFDVPTNILDISRAKSELNWAPLIDLHVGLKRTIDYVYKNHRQISAL